MKEELEKLIRQAYHAGYIYACWCDGVPSVSTEEYEKTNAELEAAEKAFLEKFGK